MEDELKIIADSQLMLTTLDNPFNPKEDYDKWRNWDIDNNYHTEALLDRMAEIPPDLEDDILIQRMIIDTMYAIVSDNLTGDYKLV